MVSEGKRDAVRSGAWLRGKGGGAVYLPGSGQGGCVCVWGGGVSATGEEHEKVLGLNVEV